MSLERAFELLYIFIVESCLNVEFIRMLLTDDNESTAIVARCHTQDVRTYVGASHA